MFIFGSAVCQNDDERDRADNEQNEHAASSQLEARERCLAAMEPWLVQPITYAANMAPHANAAQSPKLALSGDEQYASQVC